jgi:hypothetical protein
MAINQLSTSNTFQQWLVSTQVLIEKYNFYEETINLVYDTANSVYSTYDNTVNVYIETTFVYSNTVNITNELIYDTWNVANQIYTISNNVSNLSNSASNTSNLALTTSNTAFNLSSQAYTFSNTVLSLGFPVIQSAASANVHYVTFTDSLSGNTFVQLIDSSDLYYVPSTGKLNAKIFESDNVTTGNASVSGTANISNLVVNSITANTVQAIDFNSVSDFSRKTEINTLQNAIDQIMELRGVSFKWKDTGQKSIGVIAQEVEKVLPEIVSVNNFGEKSVSYGNIVGLLIQGFKEMKTDLENIKKIIINKQPSSKENEDGN